MTTGSTGTKKTLFKIDFEKQSAANKKYKDTVFRKLFHQKKELLELYNALNDSDYSEEEELQIVTLDNCLYLSMRNDLAFILDFRLHLYEHQSTPSPNMPLRDLFYVAQEYYAMVDNTSLFGERAVKIPAPRFVVFYNGLDKQPESQMLKLSDLYIPEETNPMLELQVLVLNINEGYNTWLKEKCRTMYEYMVYVDRVRYYSNQMEDLEQAVDIAIDECINEGILVEFLSRNRAEAAMFTIHEHNEEREWMKLRESFKLYAYEQGCEKGREEGYEQGHEKDREEGYEQGREKGIAESLHNLMKNTGMTEEAARVALGLKQ